MKVAASENNLEILQFLLSQKGVQIEKECFIDCSKLQKVVIPDSITYIGISSFANCISLKEITFPDTLDYIDLFAFKRTNHNSMFS